ncbi:diguanylate cyclase [Sphingomonas turrisvirgatae]|nr:diguanylate cyclase [Sphingomonas turrisvirgatae]
MKAVAFVTMLTGMPAAQASGYGAGQVGRPLAVCTLAAQPGDQASQLMRQPDRFDCTTQQRDLGPGTFWAISAPIGQRSSVETPLTLRMSSLWQDGVDLYVLYADGHVAVMRDRHTTYSRRIQLGAIVEYPLPPRAAPVERLLWHVEGAANLRGIVVGARIATAQQSARSNLAMAAIYAGFAGLAIALMIYNLALWASLRYPFQLAYCVMMLMLICYAATSSGALAWAFPGIDNHLRLRLNYLLLTYACAAALLFARAFFEEHVFGRRLRLAIQLTVAALVTVGTAFVLIAPSGVRYADPVFSSVFLGVLITVSATLWRAWRSRSNYLWIFAIAWALPIFAASVRVFANLGWIEWHFWVDNSTILAMGTEALISSIAIAYRIRLLSRERDEAIAAETVARRLADTDPLTGLLNRRAFLAAAIGRQGPQTLLLLDLDHFKQVNDTLGHDGGDEVLRVVARSLRNLAPRGALVARVGGEEFAMICGIGASLDPNALLVRLRATRMPFDLRVTASVGTATGPLLDEPDWKALYRAADAALFAAKAAGRDRVRAAPIAA